MVEKNEHVSPYRRAWEWINDYVGTLQAIGLAKVLLSCAGSQYKFSWVECVEHLDEQPKRLALDVVTHYTAFGAAPDLEQIARRLVERFPRLVLATALTALGRDRVERRVPDATVYRQYSFANESEAAKCDAAWCDIVTGGGAVAIGCPGLSRNDESSTPTASPKSRQS